MDKPKTKTENQEQREVIAWARDPYTRIAYPCLSLLFHIPNERRCTPAQGWNLKMLGVQSGVPDLCLPVACGGYNALYIEMKAKKGRVSEQQTLWIDALCRAGNYAVVCRGAEMAIATIKRYLQGEETYDTTTTQ